MPKHTSKPKLTKPVLFFSIIMFYSLAFFLQKQTLKALAQEPLPPGVFRSNPIVVRLPENEEQEILNNAETMFCPVSTSEAEDLFSIINKELVLPLENDAARSGAFASGNNEKVNSEIIKPEVTAGPSVSETISPRIENPKSSSPANTSKSIKAPAHKSTSSMAGIGLPGSIFAEIKAINGRRVCLDMKHDNPSKSGSNKKGHIDTECCLDPDETPNSLCYYPPEKYGKLIQAYLNKKK